ncbi:hypothetical protein ACFFX0_27305 [Citricoccus parietis]|uniref:Uncharacterized protein n=1 Tax=Citricoccus parietis TaxID=592307 RepID=A0ABV5G6W2_9MICC
MAEHDRQVDDDRDDAFPVADVAVAQPSGHHLDQHLTRPRLRLLALFEPQVGVDLVHHPGFHSCSFVVCGVSGLPRPVRVVVCAPADDAGPAPRCDSSRGCRAGVVRSDRRGRSVQVSSSQGSVTVSASVSRDFVLVSGAMIRAISVRTEAKDR